MVIRSPLPRVSRRAKVTFGVIGTVIVVLILASRLVDIWVSWQWFKEVDFTSVYSGVLKTKIMLFFLFGIVIAAFVAGNLYLAFRVRPMLRANSSEQHTLERYRMLFSPRLGLWIGLTAGLIGLFTGLSAQGHWQQWMLLRNGGDFGTTDPQFGVDVGYYVFQYPFWRYLLDLGFTITALVVLGSLAVHYLYGGLRLSGQGDRMTVAARVHLTALVAFFVALKAIAYFLDRRGLVLQYNGGTDVWGAGYTSVNAVLPAKEILTWISIVVAVAILVFANIGNLVWAGASLALLGISAVAIGGVYPWAVQQFDVKPNLRAKEATYIQRSIDSTQAAYGISDVETTDYPATTDVPPSSLATDTTVVPTARMLDPAVVNDVFTQYQQVRSFYDFNAKLDVDRYQVNGSLQDFVVGVRELNYGALTGQQTNWLNEHTVYTHGYGFVAAPANQVCDGAPYFVSGLLTGATGSQAAACSAPTDAIQVDQPRIYYGEAFNDSDYVVVGKPADDTTDAEYDRPAGDGNDSVTYTGSGGVAVNTTFRRLMYGLYFHEGNFLLSDVFNDNSKVMYVRNPRERVEQVAPFLTLDGDPYPAVVDGRVEWILDGYTTSATYPYSERVDLRAASEDSQSSVGTTLQAKQNINYIRNSVKATVDAYDGTVTLYAWDETDPVLKAWNKAFGGDIIKPKAEIPADLAAHFRYPEDLFNVQRDLLQRFHVTDPLSFNSGGDFWQVPDDPATTTTSGTQPPYFLLTQFPGATTERFQLTAALTPVNRGNLAALLSGVVTDDGQLKLELLELPRDGRTPGPAQAKQALANDAGVQSQILQLQGGGQSQIIYGNLLSLPYGGGLLYVQPAYIQSKNVDNAYPLLRLVLVNYGDSVGYGADLATAINSLITNAGGSSSGGSTTTPPPATGSSGGGSTTLSPDLEAAAARLDAAIKAVELAQASGDFEAYGKALAELQAAMDNFEQVRAATAAASASPSP